MTDIFVLQGRRFGPAELAEVRGLLSAHPDWSRFRLSRELASGWGWRNGVGELKDMAARTLLLKLERRGLVKLPAPRCASPNRMRPKQRPLLPSFEGAAPITGSLAEVAPLAIREVSERTARAEDRHLFEALLHRHHYLSYRRPVGENLRYLVRAGDGRPLGCVLFGAAAWQCAARDRFLGWESATRQRHLHLLANNSRFLILPWVGVRHLASHLLSRITRRLADDWQRKYGHPLCLVETFVEAGRFEGTCYTAANWWRVGQTKGRSRQDREDGRHLQVPIKDIYVYPLHPQFREFWQSNRPPGTSPEQHKP